MMAPGDEVVCVTADKPCCGRTISPGPRVGRHYIVGEVHMGTCLDCGERMPGMAPAGDGHGLDHSWGWPQGCFRPLDYDEDQHIEDAGVRLPIRVPETV